MKTPMRPSESQTCVSQASVVPSASAPWGFSLLLQSGSVLEADEGQWEVSQWSSVFTGAEARATLLESPRPSQRWRCQVWLPASAPAPPPCNPQGLEGVGCSVCRGLTKSLCPSERECHQTLALPGTDNQQTADDARRTKVNFVYLENSGPLEHFTHITLRHPHLRLSRAMPLSPHFTDEETEACGEAWSPVHRQLHG